MKSISKDFCFTSEAFKFSISFEVTYTITFIQQKVLKSERGRVEQRVKEEFNEIDFFKRE